MLIVSDFYLDIQKSFIPKKILGVPCTMYISWIALFSANTWRLDVLTFFIKGFAKDCIIFLNPLWTASWKYFTKLLYENTKAKAQLYIRFYWPTESDLTLNSLNYSKSLRYVASMCAGLGDTRFWIGSETLEIFSMVKSQFWHL